MGKMTCPLMAGLKYKRQRQNDHNGKERPFSNNTFIHGRKAIKALGKNTLSPHTPP